jgi:putative intracellular protease/amidase
LASIVARNVAVLIFDGFADWEPAYALAGLRRWGGRSVTAVGYDRRAVTSMGGLHVDPDDLLESLTPATTEMVLLPGGDAWTEAYPASRTTDRLAMLASGGVTIAAICGATVAVARAGLLAGRRHTSNDAAFLRQHAPGYETPALYTDALAVTDHGVITASGLGAVEFAHEIFAALGVLGTADLSLYLERYGRGARPAPASPPVRP